MQIVNIAYGDDLCVWLSEKSAQHLKSASAATDKTDGDAVAGRRLVATNSGKRYNCRRGQDGRSFQKIAARKRFHKLALKDV
jgi:hypothetical protein